MKQNSIRTTGATIGIALAVGAFALWSNQAEPTASEFQRVAEIDSTQLVYLNVRSLADLFPHGR